MKGKHIKLVDIPRIIIDEEAETRTQERWASWWKTYRASGFFKKLWMRMKDTPAFAEDGTDQRDGWSWFAHHRMINPAHAAILEGSYVVGDGWHVVAIRGDHNSDVTLTLERDIESETPYR